MIDRGRGARSSGPRGPARAFSARALWSCVESWSGERLGFGPDDGRRGRATVDVHSPDVYRQAACAAASGWARPTPTVSGTSTTWPPCFGSACASVAATIVPAQPAGPAAAARSSGSRSLPVLNTRRGARRNIAAHYDLGNEMFELFLDREWMMYSSALFERARRDARAGPGGQAGADLRAPRAAARPAPARDRHRLGRPRPLRGVALRLPRDHDHDLARAARVRRGAGPGRRASRTACGCSAPTTGS